MRIQPRQSQSRGFTGVSYQQDHRDGILTEDGTLHELDMIIFATGFDVIDGNYNSMRIRGSRGETLKEH